MKAMSKNGKRKARVFTLSLLMGMSPTVLMAQDSGLLDDTEAVVNSEEIDIEGAFRSRSNRRVNRMAIQRKAVEKKNEELVRKKMEKMRVLEERRLARKLKRAFKSRRTDRVRLRRSSPRRITAKRISAKKEKKDGNIRFIPYGGVRQYDGDIVDNFESNVNVGVAGEYKINKRLAVGVTLEYTRLEFEDESNQLSTGFINFNTQGDIIDVNRYSVGVHSKFFILPEARVKPFVGAGLAYNRTKLEYTSRNPNNAALTSGLSGFGFNGGDDDITGSNVSGTVMAGAEVFFTKNFGLTADVRYSRALTDGFTQQSQDPNSNLAFRDEIILNNFGSALDDANEFSFNIGLIVAF